MFINRSGFGTACLHIKLTNALALCLMIVGCTSCITFTTFHHNEDTAAAQAIRFAKEAFIDLNQPEAYGYLSKEVRSNFSFDKFNL